MSHRLLRASAATIALAAIAVGVPAALATWGRWPIRGLPTADQLRDLPMTLVSDTAVFAILTVAAWVLWALFMMSVVIEAKAELTGREPAAWLIPAVIRRPASILVAAMLMTASVLGSSQRASAVPLTARLDGPELSSTAAETTRPPAVSLPAAIPGASTLPEIEVRRGDNPWDLATTHLGDPMRWRELWELNRGVPQADGMAWTVPDIIEPGWRLRLPADARVPTSDAQSTYIVLPGDTLSEIALDHLGSVERFPEIFERNVGRPQPDGETLTDPDHIEPGWQLELADSAPAAPELVPPVVTDVPAPPASVPESPVTAPPATAESPTATSISPPPPSISASPEDGSRQLPVGLIGGGTATAGLLLLLERRRRAALRRRAAGTQPAPLRVDLDTAERELRTGAARGRSAHVDAALRAIAGEDPDALGAVRMVLVDDDHVRIDLDADRGAPDGFRSVDARTWETDVPVEVLDELGSSQPAPLPALCAIGTATDGTEVLINLERDPVTIIEAPDDVRTEMLNSIAAAVMTAPWSSHPRVLCVGMNDCAGLGMESQATLADALTAATSTCAESESDVLPLRLSEPESWEPTIVLSALHPNAADAATLDALTRQRHSAIAVVCPPHRGIAAARRVQVTPGGEIAIDDSAPEASPSRLSDGDLGRIGDLLGSATSFVEPEPATEAVNDSVDLRDAPTESAPISLELLRSELDVVINVLGEVEAWRIRPSGDDDRITVAKQRALEAIAYVALRQSSVDREDVQAALWPDGTNSAKTFSNAIWEARRVLGSDARGADLLPDAIEGRYTMSDRVGTDYGLFCDLVAGAAEVDPELSAALLTEALGLVRGEPFVGVGRSYAWVGPHRGMIAAQVLDAAERLAEVRLARGDWRGAEWAARQGLRAMPCDERMYRLLMRAAHLAGNTSGVHRAFKELCDVVADPDTGAEPDDTVHPETVGLLEQLTTSPSRRVTA
jgi:DNA-binding SARP family transcriptional activator